LALSWFSVRRRNKKNRHESDINKQKEKPPAGMLATEVRAGDAPKPAFSMNIYEKIKDIRKSTPRQP